MNRFRDKKIHIVQMLILSLFIIITAVSISPILRETEKRMRKIQTDLITSLENAINYEISYSSISPSIFSYINIRDLTIYKDKKNNIILARIKTFKAFYSPFYFLKKDSSLTPLQAVKRFNINNASININQKRESELLSLLQSDKESSISLFPLTTVVTGKNIDLTVETESGIYEAGDLFITLTPENGAYKTRIDGLLKVRFNDSKAIVKDFFSKISLRGTLAEYFDSLNFTVKTKGFSSDIIDLKDQTFQVVYSSEELLIRKVEDDRPIDLALRYNRELGELVLTFNAEEFKPATIADFKGSLIAFAPYASSQISGNGSLLINNSSSTFLYSLDSEIELNRNIFDREISLKTDFTGDKKEINVRSLDIQTIEGQVLFSGNIITETMFPSGRVTLNNIQTPYGHKINSTLDIERDSGFLYVTTDTVHLGYSSVENLNLVIFPDKKLITASLKAEIIDENGLKGEIVADSLFDFTSGPQLNSYIQLSQLPMRGILDLIPGRNRIFSFPSEVKDLSLYSSIMLSTDFNSASAQINKFLLVSDNNAENQLSFSASYSDKGFNVNDLYINWDEYNLNGYINSNKKDDEYIITTLFDLEEKPYRLQAVLNGEGILIEGDYGLYGFIQNLGKNHRSFTLKSMNMPIPVLGETIYADLDVNGFLSGNDWKIYMNNTGLYGENFYSLESPSLIVNGEIDKSGCNLYDMTYRDNLSSLQGLGRLTYGGGELSSWLSLVDESGTTDEQYDLFFNKSDDEIESRMAVISTPLERFKQSGLSGRLSGDLVFTGTLKEPDIKAVFHTDRMVLNGVSVEVSSFLRGDKDVIRVSDLELNYDGLIFNRGLILLEMNQGKLLATAGINQNINRSRASTAVTAIIRADNSFDIFTLNQLNTSQLEGRISLAPITWDNSITFPQLDIMLKKDKNILSASIGAGEVLSARYNMENGDISGRINELFPLRLQASGRIKDSLIDMNLKNIFFDPVFINYFMPTEFFKGKRHAVFTGGEIVGDLHITGKLSDPDYYGELKISELLVESPYIAEIPKAATTTAHFEGSTITVEPLVIDLNDGAVEADASFEFDGALPTSYKVDVNLKGPSGARIAYEIPKFSWDGHVLGYARIEGSKQGGFLKGTLISNDLKTSLESSVEGRVREKAIKSPSVNGFIVDLTIQTGRNVNFYLPNEDLPIIQATANNGDTLNIGYDSRSSDLSLVGKIDIRTGEINYFNKTFYLQEGYIEFNESQVKFNPRLNVRADVVTTDALGDDITISLLFDDYLMNEFNPEFLSFPSKSENEILALLGQSFIPFSDSENVSVASLLVATGGMIGKNTIMQPFEKAIKSSLQLDLVSFNTNIIENAILDRLQEEELDDNDSKNMNFAKYLEDTSLFVGEYIGDYLFLEGSLVVDYDESKEVTSTMGGLELLVNLNLQFITPFVLIDWSYNPKNNPDSDYFLPQNTITFTWRYSF